jgi:urease accessory protein
MLSFRILQLADSAFPTGGFAHSSGLEAAWQNGEVTPDTLGGFVRDLLWQAGHGLLPLVSAAHHEPGRLEALDAFADCWLTNPVANRASRMQGRALASTAARVWPDRAVLDLDARVQGICGHVGPVTGAVYGALDVPLPVCQRLVLFAVARGLFAAAVRLGIVGGYQAQAMQDACAPDLDRVLAACARLGEDDVAQTAPIIDLVQASHDRLYSRLFQS